MSEFFLELFSEEIPAGLQQNARNILLENFQNYLQEKKYSFKKSSSFSTPNRLIILFEGLSKEIIPKSRRNKRTKCQCSRKSYRGFFKVKSNR